MKLAVMTWNVENLFRPGADGATTHAAYRAKLDTIANTISTLGVDVVALQEIGSPESFADLHERLRTSYPHAALSAKPGSRGIRVAFLSKHPFTKQQDIVDFAPNLSLSIRAENNEPITRLRRGALWVRITAHGLPVNLIAVHLKSKLLDYPRPGGGSAFSTKDENLRARVASTALAVRALEAVSLRTQANVILTTAPHEALIVLGDLNDVPEAASTQILCGPEGSQPGTRGFDRADAGDPARLFNLAAFIPEPRRFSRVHRGERELIDHIFVSEHLVPFAADGKRVRPEVDSHTELNGALPSVTNDPTARKDEPASDHAAVTARFEF